MQPTRRVHTITGGTVPDESKWCSVFLLLKIMNKYLVHRTWSIWLPHTTLHLVATLSFVASSMSSFSCCAHSRWSAASSHFQATGDAVAHVFVQKPGSPEIVTPRNRTAAEPQGLIHKHTDTLPFSPSPFPVSPPLLHPLPHIHEHRHVCKNCRTLVPQV